MSGKNFSSWGMVWVFCAGAALASAAVDFTRDVQPILRRNCYSCHGAGMQQSGFRLDDAEQALKGGYSGA
ncbi:MAG: c-type cytochrome domain-containing protein, partial [bacterium]